MRLNYGFALIETLVVIVILVVIAGAVGGIKLSLPEPVLDGNDFIGAYQEIFGQ